MVDTDFCQPLTGHSCRYELIYFRCMYLCYIVYNPIQNKHALLMLKHRVWFIFTQYNSVMAFLYLILATVWIIIWARSHKHTLKIHVVMGFIAVAGKNQLN